ncbi:MAG: dihydroorotase [Acidobacteria bacterium]|nr:MAG: dihydroorotase [Acidobacteriota bacterium]
MDRLLLRGARVVDPASGLDGVRDVLVAGGRIVSVAAGITERPPVTIDLDGLVLAPGFIDMHVHLREPGQEHKETIASGCAAAAAGGFTAIASMANTEPVNDCRAVTEMILAEARRHGSVRVYPVGAVSKGLEGRELAPIGEMVEAGAVAVSDDGRPIEDASLMRRALQYARLFGIPVLAHEEDPSLVGDGVAHEGPVAARLGLPGWPAAAEDSMIARDLLLAEDVGGRLHIQHVTTGRGLELIRWSRARGVPVTCEVTPHHLTLTDEAIEGFGTNYKMNPPLRTEEDRRALVGALAGGEVDAVATDHAPHHRDEKAVEFRQAPFGVVGLETAVPVLLDRLVRTGEVPLPALVAALSTGPARALGVAGGRIAPGEPADFTVLDLERERTVEAAGFRSRASNTPFEGWSLTGWPVMTVVAGRVIHDSR